MDSTQEKLAFLGWDVGDAAALDSLAETLKGSGINVGAGEPGLASERRVEDVAIFSGPDGVRHEVFFGQKQASTAFASALVPSGFKTGAEGLGHAVLAAENRQAATAWYQNHLGFKLSDEVKWDDAEATFMHCNPRHHSLAVLNCCMGMSPGQLNHIMLEMNSLEDVGKAYDRVRAAGTPLALHIGQHSNDKIVSFYLVTPSGVALEVGHGGIAVDDKTWQPTTYTTPKIWGHDPADGPAVV
ncbi:MAG: VOC family protein [Pseudomonadota bacterium]